MVENTIQKRTASNETRFTVAITDLIISESFSLNLSQKPRFKKVLDFARTVSKSYQPSKIKLLYKYIWDVIHNQNIKRNLSLIKKESDIFGLLFLVDGVTISRIPLLEILVSGKDLPVAVLELVDCQVHLADCGKKDGSFICNIFPDHI